MIIKNQYIYLLLNKKYTLDGDFSWNTAGLINHSCDNNCDYEGKGLKIWVTAIKDIKKGEEFTCDYGFGFDKDYKQFPCKCRAKNCCGYIVRAESRWRINKKFSMSNKKKLINNSRQKKVLQVVQVEHIKLFFLILLHLQIFSNVHFFLQDILNNQPLIVLVVVKKIEI